MNGRVRQTGRPAAGFTLIELLISMGIMAIGLVMAGALFPAAIKQTQSSVEDTIGTIICENALAVVRAHLEYDDIVDLDAGRPSDIIVGRDKFEVIPVITNRLVAPGDGDEFAESDLAYPVSRTPRANFDGDATEPEDWRQDANSDWRPNTNYGALVLIRSFAQDENDYHLLVISYKKKYETGPLPADEPYKNKVVPDLIALSVENRSGEDFTRIAVRDAIDRPKLQRGTPVIIDDIDVNDDVNVTVDDVLHGVYGMLAAYDATLNEGRLKGRLPETWFPAGTTVNSVICMDTASLLVNVNMVEEVVPTVTSP